MILNVHIDAMDTLCRIIKNILLNFTATTFMGIQRSINLMEYVKLRRMRFDEIYDRTMEIMYRLKTLGYEVIYIWEKDYKQYLIDKDNEYLFEGLFEYSRLL